MLDLLEHRTLDQNTASQDDLDFDFLRKTGIDYIQSLGSKLWTDYNSHDPGITILEVLCYALTDLGQRINLPLEDLLAKKDTGIAGQFHKAETILRSKPVTHLDYRKLFIDVPGVRNAWLLKHEKQLFINTRDNKLSYKSFLKNAEYAYLTQEQQEVRTLNGLYDLIVDLDGSRSINSLRPQLMKLYQENRNLCEDLIHITEVGTHPVKVCAQIELDTEANENEVKAHILSQIEHYFSPAVKPKTLAELLDKGYASTEIFNGPLLENGFLEDQEVKEAALKTEVRQSDIINLIMSIDGVKNIKAITLGACNDNTPENISWVIPIEAGRKPVLCDKSSWSFHKGFIPVVPDSDKVAEALQHIKDSEAVKLQEVKDAIKHLETPQGTFINASQTISIQNDFPEVYGIGKYGIKGKITTETRAKAKQLKGYLFFFDQILANYFKHLEEVSTMLSVSGKERRNYFAQAVSEIKNTDELVNDFKSYQDPDLLTERYYPNFEQINLQKRHEILDHLLARFAERFGEYAFLMRKIYGQFANDAIIETKERFLTEYAETSCQRASAFNWYKQAPENLWDSSNISALQERLYLLLGITDTNRRNLSEDAIEIYEELDTDNILEYRWRIKDGAKQILSSATKNYKTLEELYQELILVKKYALDKQNYKFKKIRKKNADDPDEWYFVIINPTVNDPKSEDYIIARRIQKFKSKASAVHASKAVLNLIKTLQGNEGMYLIEHILLRPDVTTTSASEDSFLPICSKRSADTCEPLDPYSFRLSIVLPGWTVRFGNIEFRRFVEDLIRRELPAHILAKICWIGYPKHYTDAAGNPPEENEMVILEEAYKNWLLHKTNMGQKQDPQSLIKLNAILSSLHTLYHQGYLHNCKTAKTSEDQERKSNQKVILGRTHLGKI